MSEGSRICSCLIIRGEMYILSVVSINQPVARTQSILRRHELSDPPVSLSPRPTGTPTTIVYNTRLMTDGGRRRLRAL